MAALVVHPMPRLGIDNVSAVCVDARCNGRSRGRRLLPLWTVVSGLWTAATLLRVNQVWVPLIGWHDTLVRPLFWISLLAAPAIFAVVFGAIHRRTNHRQCHARNVMS